VRSTPLGMSCSELQEYNAPRPSLRMSLRLRFCPQSGYVPAGTTVRQPAGRLPGTPPVYFSGSGFY